MPQCRRGNRRWFYPCNGKGVPALSIGIATRYIHSHAAMRHRDDFENAVKLVVEVIKTIRS